jgi:hypothetical protein
MQSVLFLNGMYIGRLYQLFSDLASCKSAYQHKQSRFWEMEVCEQAAHDLELMAGADEDARLSRVRRKNIPSGC